MINVRTMHTETGMTTVICGAGGYTANLVTAGVTRRGVGTVLVEHDTQCLT